MRSLALNIPKPRVDEVRLPKGYLFRVKQWLDDLPKENTRESAQRLYQSLYAQSRSVLPPESRLRMLELYPEPVGKVVEKVNKWFTTKTLPLAKDSLEMATLVQELQIELANGYKIAIRDLIGQGIGRNTNRLTRSQLVLPLQRAVYQIGQVLLNIYQAHLPTPGGIWNELHQLYWYASNHGLADESVRAHGSGAPDSMMTVAESYQQVVLLGASHPYSLFPAECVRVYAFLSGWQRHVEITQRLECPSPAGRFLINLAVDGPAIPMVKIGKVEPADHLRMLNATEMLDKLHSIVKNWEESPGKEDTAAPPPETDAGHNRIELLRHVGGTWSGTTVTRKSKRTPIEVSVFACVGIDAIYYFASDKCPFTPPTTLDAEPMASTKRERGWRRQFHPTRPSADDLHKLYQCQTQDESAGGFRIVAAEDEKMRVQVGDVVGLEHPWWETWVVGVVRWQQSEAQNVLSFGVELLAPKVKPVAVRCLGSDIAENVPYVPGLLLPALEPLRQSESLILPRGTFKPPLEFELVDQDHASRAVLPTIVVEKNNRYERVTVA